MPLSRTHLHTTLGSTRLPSQKYLPASRVFLFHNTRLLSPDRVRCFLFPIPPASLENIYPPRGFFCFITHGCYLRTVCDVSSSQSHCIPRKYLPASRRVFVFHNTQLLSSNRVRCFLFPIPTAAPRKYLPTLRVFLFHNTRLLSLDCVRCFLFPILPASLENICPPRGILCFITHGCYLRTVCDALSSKFSIAQHFTPAFDSRIVKFSVPASFPQTPRFAPSTHTHQNLLEHAHTHTHTLPRSKP